MTKGTIGNGNITIGNIGGSTPLSDINRDIGATQIVTKEKQSAFTAYVDRAATVEAYRLLSLDKEKSLILKDLEILKKIQP